MVIPPIPPGNQVLAAAISPANTPCMRETPSPVPEAKTLPPLAFLAETSTETRNSLQLNADLVQHHSPHARQSITPSERSIRSILCATVYDIVAITTQLDTVTIQLSEICKGNKELRSNLHVLLSKIANESATNEDIRPLHSTLRDLSHCVITTAPTARPTAPTSRPTAPMAPPQCLPARGKPTPLAQPLGPPPPPRVPTHAPSVAQLAPSPPQETIVLSIHCPVYETKLKRIFSNPELYAKAFPHSWEAERFSTNQYSLSVFTPTTLHRDYTLRTAPTYVQVAGLGPGQRKRRTKQVSATRVARGGNKGTNALSSLPMTSRRFFAGRSNAAPDPLAQCIAGFFPDIAATTLSESNWRLLNGFIVKVNNQGADSLTGTNPDTPAESYAPYVDALTRRLNQSFPIGDNPWLTFTQVPTAIQLAIDSIPTHILPDDDEHLFTFITNSIHNVKAFTIGAARYLNKDQAARWSKQATAVVVSVNPDDVPILLRTLFHFSKWLKVEKTRQANCYTQGINCYQVGHASPRCTQKHPICPYCALHHTRSAHSCQNPTCPKGGDSEAVSGWYPTTHPHSSNCGDDHDTFFRECMVRPTPPPQPDGPPPYDEELSDASSDSDEGMDVGDDGRRHALLPKPLQPKPSTFRPFDPSNNLEKLPPPLVGPP